MIQAAQTVISRYTDPMQPVVISFTQISGGVAHNIIADNVILKGTMRSLDFDTSAKMKTQLKKIADGIAATFGAKIDIEYLLDYPSVLNDKNVHGRMKPALESTFGTGNVIETQGMLGGEDFAFYSRKVPSMFYFLGAKNDAEECFFVHHPKVIINEECIKYGSQFFSDAAVSLLGDR